MKKTITILVTTVISFSALNAGIIGSNYVGATYLKTSDDIDGYSVGINWAALEDKLDISILGAYSEYSGYDSSFENQKSAILSGRYYTTQSFGKPFVELGVGYARQEFWSWIGSVKSFAVLGSVGVELDIAEKWSFIPSLSYTFLEAASDGQFSVGGTLYYRVVESLSLGLGAAYTDTEVGGTTGVGLGLNIHL